MNQRPGESSTRIGDQDLLRTSDANRPEHADEAQDAGPEHHPSAQLAAPCQQQHRSGRPVDSLGESDHDCDPDQRCIGLAAAEEVAQRSGETQDQRPDHQADPQVHRERDPQQRSQAAEVLRRERAIAMMDDRRSRVRSRSVAIRVTTAIANTTDPKPSGPSSRAATTPVSSATAAAAQIAIEADPARRHHVLSVQKAGS